MRQIKRALDPKNILNPGKIFEPAVAPHEIGFIEADQPCC